ncbi:MAG TPA: DUF6600 domain-containing protein [Pyrinomonadaceae bacterium]
MRSLKSLLLPLLFLATAFTFTARASAADDVDENEYEEHARVMRVSLMRGEVSLRRAGNVEWERAKLNLPLVEGDTLATGPDSRLEIQIDAHNFVRVGADSVLRVVTLREEGIAVSLSEGAATLRLARFDKDKEYFELDAPRTTVAAERRGLYRVDVARDGGVRVTVRDEGRARVYSESSGFTLRNNRSARLYIEDGEGDWELATASAFDEWDTWNDERERNLASRLRYEQRERYYDRDVWGAEELDSYGDWHHTSQYGWVWRPHVTVVNHYHNWAPYRYGHWRWVHPYGWTWVADEEWGWAPYHYGRWVVYNNNWCWAPRGYGYEYRRAWWRPALVAFVYIPTSYGEHVAWYPLRHGQHDPRGRWGQRRPDRLAPLRARDAANLERVNPLLLRGVTAVPARDFGADSLRGRAAAADIARRTVTGEPVRGRLPITPADVGRTSTFATPARVGPRGEVRTGAGVAADSGAGARPGNREGLRINRSAPVTPPRDIPQRDTGAASRTPGVPLDEELRRTRVLGGRELRFPSPTSDGADARDDDRGTGAVARPARPARVSPTERGLPAEGAAPSVRRPRTPGESERSFPSPGTSVPTERTRPAERERDDEGDAARPARPSRVGRPEVDREQPSDERPASRPRADERPEPRERVRPREEERLSPPVRHDPPPQREERPAPRHEPAPRQETPPQRDSAPPPSNERPAAPPPQRQERPAPPSRDSARPARPARNREPVKSDEP